MDQITLTPEGHFASWIYTTKKPEFLDGAIAASLESLADVKSSTPVNASYPMHMSNSLIGHAKTKLLEQFIADASWTIMNDQGYQMNAFETFVSEFWAQEHHKYSGMDQHVHPYGAMLSGFYFLQTPENGCMVEIHDPRPGKVQASLPMRDLSKIFPASNSILIKPEPGLLVFTNSWLPHSFTHNGSDDPVLFTHFNVAVRLAPPKEEPVVV